jgi:hypothetical protein
MFFAEALTVDAPLAMAEHRLLAFLSAGDSDAVASAAFGEGATTLTRAGVAGVSKTVKVESIPAYLRAEAVVIPIRWTATGPLHGAFPVLDANIELTADGSRTRIEVVGSYRPPLGKVGATLDQLLLKSVARSTIHNFLDSLREVATQIVPAATEVTYRIGLAEPES